MGFFGRLWNGIKEAAKTAVAVAVAPVVLVGYGVKKAYDKVKEVFSDPPKIENIPEPPPLPPEPPTTTDDVSYIQKILHEYWEIYKPEGEAKEQACKDYVNACFDGIIKKLRENDELAKSFGIDQLTRKKDRLCRDIDGVIVEAIRKHLSLDDYECRSILEMDSGSEKGRRMREFVLKTIIDARSELSDIVSQKMNQINDDLTNFLNDKVETEERTLNSKANKFKQWEHDMKNNTFDIERAQLPARKKLYAIEQIEKVIAA